MANNELLLETLNYIKENPQKWMQDVWFGFYDADGNRILEPVELEEVNSCNTAFCFAGHAALKTGFPAPPVNGYEPWVKSEYDPVAARPVRTFVDEYAQKQLGLTWDQADVLFSGDNSLEDLETLVNAIIENPDIDQDDLLKAVDRYYDDERCGCCSDDVDDDDDDEIWR